MGNRTSSLKSTVSRRRSQLEQNRRVSFGLAAFNRFKEIDGPNLAIVIAANAFIAIIPLLIILYSVIQGFNPNRSVGNVLIDRFHLTGSTADTVKATFTTAKAGKSVALSISLISLVITGIGISGTVGTAYARAFRMSQPQRMAEVRAGMDLAHRAAGDDVADADCPLLGCEPTVVVRPYPRPVFVWADAALLLGYSETGPRPPIRLA